MNEVALGNTAFVVVFAAFAYLFFSVMFYTLRYSKALNTLRMLDWPMLMYRSFGWAVVKVAVVNRLDLYSLSAGLTAFIVVAASGFNPRPAVAAMVLTVILFNTVRPTRKVTQPA